MMENKEERKKLKPVVDLSPSPWKKFLGNFIKADRKTMGEWFFKGVLYPGIQNLILEALSMLFFNSSTGKSNTIFGKSSLNSGNSQTPYNLKYNGNSNTGLKNPVTSTGLTPYDELAVPSMGDANEIISQLGNLVQDYGKATLLDLYTLVGMQTMCDFQHDKWGWTKETWGRPVPRVSGNGWLLGLSPVVHLE